MSLTRLATALLALLPIAGPATAGDDSQAAATRHTIIHAGTLLARPGSPPLERATVLVTNDRIDRVESGYLSAEDLGLGDARLIDLSDHFVLPGLMDAHVHLLAQTDMFIRAGRSGKGLSQPDLTTYTLLHAQRTLATGFTTVRDVGSDDRSVFAVRDAIARGDFIGPRILVSGPAISATGGHEDRGRAGTRSLDPDVRLHGGVCDGPDECMRMVRHLKKIGADFIKFTATGGFQSGTGTEQQYDEAEMRAIIDTAHQRGMKVAAHAYAADAIRTAVRAGVDSIEHGWLLDDAGIRLMKRHGTYLVPTLLISQPSRWAAMAGTGKAVTAMRDKAQAFEKAYAKGVNIAFGTDTGIFDHGQNALEFEVMTRLGMTPSDAIRSATISTAKLFGLEQEAGSLEPGKVADIIAVKRNPLNDITALFDVDFVMKSGKPVKTGGHFDATVETRPVGEAVKF